MAIIALINYLDTVSPEDVPLPDWAHLSVTSKETIRLNFDKIFIDDIVGNSTKVETHTAEEIVQLRLSFGQGVSTQEFPPSVRQYTNGSGKHWKLVYGYGRTEAIQLNNQKEYYFTVLDGTEDALEDVQAQENEQLPKRLNGESDMKKFLSDKVRSKKIANTESAIRAKFKKVYSNRGTDIINRIVAQVMDDCETPQPYIFYTSKVRVKEWIDNHSKEEYSVDADYDKSRQMYGVVMKEGYQKRAVVEAIERYKETGKFTYIIGHLGAPTKKSTFKSKRKNFLARFEEIKEAMESCGLTIWPIVVMGFLPQDKEVDNLKVLITV